MVQKKKLELTVGLDIGSYSVKYVELSQGSGAYQLHRVLILPLNCRAPSRSVAVQQILKVIFDSYQDRVHSVRISVSGPSLLIRRIQLPVMSKEELKGAIVFEAESHIPFPIDDCQLDFQILNTEQGNKTMNVLLVATKKDFIRERLKALSVLNIVPEIIDVDIFCLMNAFEIFGEDGGQKTYGLLNIGHETSSFVILQEKLPFVVREIPMGGRRVTQALAEARGITEEEADPLKSQRTDSMTDELKDATQKGYETLIEELKHSIDYFENETGEDLKHIWVSGGGVLTQGALPIFSEELGRQVEFWDNLKKMGVFGGVDQNYLTEHAHELNVVLGMASRRLGQKP